MDASEDLPPLEAALLMGITPELLFAYTRYSPKKSLGEARRLPIHETQGQAYFRRSELLAFDAFLHEPWAAAGDERPRVPLFITDYLKVECGGQCARCGAGFPLENAHIQAYAQTRCHHHHNLIRLCATCHGQFDAGIVTSDDLRRNKDGLVLRIRTRLESSRACEILPARSLPAPTNKLVGRADVLDTLEGALGAHRVVSVFGPGGSGKTELALHALARAVDPRQVLWIEVDSEISAFDLEIVLRSAVPKSADGQSSSMAALLDAFGGYVVFDGVEQAPKGEFEAAVGALIAGTSRVRFLFTSQVRFLDLPIDRGLNLSPLVSDASRALLCAGWHLTSSREEEDALAWLENFAEGHPLTLRLTNSLLRFYERASVVAQRIREHGASAVSHPLREVPARATSLERCLRTAYVGLSTSSRRVMYVASHCPAGFFEEMLVNGPIEIEDGHAAMAGLRHWHLLQIMWRSEAMRRLRALSPVRAFFRDAFVVEYPEDAAALMLTFVQEIALHSVVMDHSYFSGGEVALGMERFDAELPNLLHALGQAQLLSPTQPQYLEHIRQIASSLQVFCFISGSSQGAVEVMRLGMEAAVQTAKYSSAAGMAMHLLIQAQRLGDEVVTSEAIDALRALTSRTGASDVAAQRAMAEAMLAERDHRADDALKWAVVAEDLLEGAVGIVKDGDGDGEDSPSLESLSMALMTKGRALEELSNSKAALASYERALEVMVRCGDVINPGAVMHQMGNCHGRSGDFAKAFDCYIEATSLFTEMGIVEHIGNSLSELGYLLLDYEAGIQRLSDAISVESIAFGAKDVMDSVERAYLGTQTGRQHARRAVSLRRLLGLCMLASFARHEVKVIELCDLVRRQVVMPLSIGLAGGREPGRLVQAEGHIDIMLLDVSMAFAGNLCAVVQDNDPRPSLAVCGIAAMQCFQLPPHTSSGYRLPQWLAIYLRCCHKVVGITPRDLASAVRVSHETSREFSLDRFTGHFS